MEKRFDLIAGDFIYNPIGNILGRIAAPGYISFMQSMCDLEGMNRIVRLQLLLRIQHVDDNNIQNFINQVGQEYSNPFTNQPMQFYLKDHTITFQPIAARDNIYLPWPI